MGASPYSHKVDTPSRGNILRLDTLEPILSRGLARRGSRSSSSDYLPHGVTCSRLWNLSNLPYILEQNMKADDISTVGKSFEAFDVK